MASNERDDLRARAHETWRGVVEAFDGSVAHRQDDDCRAGRCRHAGCRFILAALTKAREEGKADGRNEALAEAEGIARRRIQARKERRLDPCLPFRHLLVPEFDAMDDEARMLIEEFADALARARGGRT